MISLLKIKSFMSLLHQFHTVDRVANVPTLKRRTNAVEHSYQLAMLAWYIVSSYKLPLNLERVLHYALAHDLVEAYAGDTFIHDSEGRETKVKREAEAFEKIVSDFPEFNELKENLLAYEERKDMESKFVYALDKFLDPLNSSMITDRESIWKEFTITLEQHQAYKKSKIAESEFVVPLWDELQAELIAKKDFFFPKE